MKVINVLIGTLGNDLTWNYETNKINVIQQVSDLTSYNAPISCTTLSTSDITATSDQTKHI